MQQRYTFILVAAALLLLAALSQSMLSLTTTATAQTGGTSTPSATLNASPVVAAIREQGTAAVQMVTAAHAQGTSVAQLAAAAAAQGTTSAQLVEVMRGQATSAAQLVLEAQAGHTAVAALVATQAAEIEALGQRLANCTVTGTGYVEIKVPPDAAIAQIDVKTIGSTLDEAMKRNALEVKTITQELQIRLALVPSDIQVMSPQIAPVLGDDRAITDYRVLTPLQVTVANPTGPDGSVVLAQVLALGGGSFKDVTFKLQDTARARYEAQARQQAFEQARAQAGDYARMAQGKLGPIISVNEDVNSRREPPVPAPGKPSVPLITAQVSVVFALNGPCGLPTPAGR